MRPPRLRRARAGERFPLGWSVPRGLRAWAVEPGRARTIPLDAPRVIAALRRPTAGPPLAERVREGARVLVVVPDATRRCPDDRLLPAIESELRRGGARRVDVIAATGLHRPMTPSEKRARFGRRRVLDHDARRGPFAEFDVGGVRARANRRLAEADLVVVTGVVEPHEFAGYSGGGKAVAVGLADEAAIEAVHGLDRLDDRRVGPGRIAGNPVAAWIRRVAAAVPVGFIVNVVVDSAGRPVALATGDVAGAHDAAIQSAARLHEVRVGAPYDLVVTAVPAVKGVNLYQASRAATFAAHPSRPLVRQGGAIVVVAPCPEGAGRGEGERRFARAMAAGDVTARLRRRGVRPGEQRAYVLARTLRRARVYFAGTECPGEIVAIRCRPSETVAEVVARERPRRVLVLPDAFAVVPGGRVR